MTKNLKGELSEESASVSSGPFKSSTNIFTSPLVFVVDLWIFCVVINLGVARKQPCCGQKMYSCKIGGGWLVRPRSSI